MKSKCVVCMGICDSQLFQVLPVVVGQPITPRQNAFEVMTCHREQLACPAKYIASGTHTLRADQQVGFFRGSQKRQSKEDVVSKVTGLHILVTLGLYRLLLLIVQVINNISFWWLKVQFYGWIYVFYPMLHSFNLIEPLSTRPPLWEAQSYLYGYFVNS
jgi:hypothetical protein